MGVQVGHRGDPNRDVLDQLGGCSSSSAREHGAEAVVVDDADDQLDSTRDHPLHEQTLELQTRARDGRLDLKRRAVHGVRPVEVQTHPAGVGLVKQSRGDRLERHRSAESAAASTASSASGTTRALTSGRP